MTNEVPSAVSVITTLIGVTWRRVLRGRALWVSVVLALLPTLMAIAMSVAGEREVLEPIAVITLFVMALLPPVFVAGSLGEEIEDRTTTYLWSRPIGRWTIVVGKLLALAPLAMALIALAWVVAAQVGTGELPTAQSTLAFAAGAAAISAMAAGIGTLVPKHGMALSIVYIVIVDNVVGEIPASVQSISIMRQVRLLAGFYDGTSLTEPAITMAIIASVWLAIGFWRIRRLES
jgi:hypothetical protein